MKVRVEYIGPYIEGDKLKHTFKIVDPIYFNIEENESNKKALMELIEMCNRGEIEVVIKGLTNRGRPLKDNIFKEFQKWLINKGLSPYSAHRYCYIIKKLKKGKIKQYDNVVGVAMKHWCKFISEMSKKGYEEYIEA